MDKNPNNNNENSNNENQNKNNDINTNEEEENEIFEGEEEQINPEDIIDIEEIDKDKEMDIENENISNEIKEEIEYDKEYPDFLSKGEIYSIAIHNSTLIIGDGDDTTTFFNLDKKEIIKSEKYNKDSVNFIKISNDKKYMITASVDGTINIFDPNDNFKLLNTINDQDSEINWIEWHPKGNAFSFGTSEGSVWIYLANNINNNFNFFSHTESTTCGSFCNLGKNLVSGSEDLSLKIYDLKNRKVEFTIKGKKFMQNPITCLNVSDKKPIVAVASIDNEFSIVNYENGNILFYVMFPEKQNSIETIQWCNNNNYVIFSDSKSNVHIFDNNTLQVRTTIKLDDENVTKMIKSNINSYEIFASGSNGNFYIFDCRGNGSIIQKEKVHKDVIMDFIVTEKENFIITSSIDKTINLVKVVNIN